jgi:ribosomal protein S18 acetylase RimI-like enzyme
MQIIRLVKGDEEKALEAAIFFGEDEYPEVAANLTSQDVAPFLADENNYLIAAYVEDKLAGFVWAVRMQRLDQNRAMMFIFSIDVLPEYQRQGIGRALINELKKVCQQGNYLEMFVVTNDSTPAGVALYEATGAVRPAQDDIVYVYDGKGLEI